MKRILSFLIFIFAFSSFDACVTDSKSSDKDTTTVDPTGARKPRAPQVAYQAYDSLVFISITGNGAGEENLYWIYRDDKLLEQPVHRKTDSGTDVYILKDSLAETGVHKYTVQYGLKADALSGKSPEFAYDYEGHSRSGLVRTELTAEQLVGVTVAQAAGEVVGAFIIERKVGSGGAVTALDTIVAGSVNFPFYLDTALVIDDVCLYYRVKALDAITEEFLPASPWDSIQVKNKVWKYVPVAGYQTTQDGVQVTVGNPLSYRDNGGAYYYLYRNATTVKTGKTKVDSVPISSLFVGLSMHDLPDSGAYYYWVESIDPWGRPSARSTPTLVRFTGKAMGPQVSIQQMDQSSIVIQPIPIQDAVAYIIERSQDTAKAPLVIDTLGTTTYFPYNPSFVDHPTKDGFYYYRAIALRADGETSDPGPWMRTSYFHYDPVYGQIQASIVNRGNRVLAQMDHNADYYYVLFRSKSATGPDTLAVDTLRYSDFSQELSDVPPVGTWYYRVIEYPTNQNNGNGGYRSSYVRIEFTGKPAGPAIASLTVGSARIDITLNLDPEALAYILERSVDAKAWTVADTVSASDIAYTQAHDRPATNGFWYYRARVVRNDMSVSEPGTPMRTPSEFIYGPQIDNTLNVYMENVGTRVEFPMYPAYSYVFYLLRSDKPDWKDGIRVDSLKYMDLANRLKDVPPKGAYYYWVERVSVYPAQEGNLSRSMPIKVDFSGAPAIGALTKTAQGIQVFYPAPNGTDSLEIYRSSGKPDDLKSFELVATVGHSFNETLWLDMSVAKTSGFYHYRLAVKSGGTRSDLGAAKSIYFEPSTDQINNGLIKKSAGL